MGSEEYIAGKIALALVNVDDDISASDILMLELDNLSGTFHHKRFDAVLRYADEQQDSFHAFNLPSSPPCDLSHKEAVRFPLQDGANINIHFASTPERSRPDGGHRCADDGLAEKGSADDVVVVEEKGSADAPEEPVSLPYRAQTILIDKEFGLDSAKEWPTGTARCTSSLHRRRRVV
jgi:hypothetical protein